MKYGVMVNSGSSANLIAVAALCFKKDSPLRPGDEIIVPAISWSTTYYPLHQYGLRMKFVDVELESLNMDVEKVKAAITSKTKAIVVVSILGNPAKLEELRKLCDERGIYLFEDNCESMGASINGKYTGTFGDINTFSTFFSHHISTMEGGVILTDSRELYELSICLRAHGWTRDLPADSMLYERREDDFFEAYRFILPGYNVRPLEISGAIGLEQLKKLEKMVEIRRSNAEHFKGLFAGDERYITQVEHGKSSWFSFTIILNPELKIDRARVLSSLKQAEIEYRIITGGNFLRHDVAKRVDHEVFGEIKNANIAHDRGFFVGNFPTDARAGIDHLRKVLDQGA
jgi:CDP-6-deoxy-D-xylo-4-hexulose-3-dehydrase